MRALQCQRSKVPVLRCWHWLFELGTLCVEPRGYLGTRGMTAKLCVICREDCAGRPRTKDAKGQYYCQPCYDDALAKKQQAAVKPVEPDERLSIEPDSGDELSWLEEVAAAAPATSAPAPYAGKMNAVAKPTSEWRNPLIFGGAATLVGVGVLAMALSGSGGAAIGISILLGAAFGLWIIIEAFREKGGLWGLGCIFVPFFKLIFILLTENKFLKVSVLAYVFMAIGSSYAFFTSVDWSGMVEEARTKMEDAQFEAQINDRPLAPGQIRLSSVFGNDVELIAAMSAAQRETERFVQFYQNPPDREATFWMRVLLDDGTGTAHPGWFRVTKFAGGSFTGVADYANNGVDRRTMVKASPPELLDWMLVSRGKAVGGRTLVVERSRLTGEELAAFDRLYPYEFR